MEYETIKDLLTISRISGMIEGLSTMEGARISRAASIRLEEAADYLSAYVADMSKEDVIPDEDGKPAIGFKESRPPSEEPDQQAAGQMRDRLHG